MRRCAPLQIAAVALLLACDEDAVVTGPTHTDAANDAGAGGDIHLSQDTGADAADATTGDASQSGDAADSNAGADSGDVANDGDATDGGPSPCVAAAECPAGPPGSCAEAACVAGLCALAPAADGAECEDGDLCTGGDSCTAGKCGGGGAVDCDDGGVCTDDGCDAAVGCTHQANTLACDDGDACTAADVCAQGACVGGPAPDCDDANPCTTDVCPSAAGCAHTDNSAPCDDGDACTSGDTCAAGSCAPGPAMGCNDGNPCTDDACDPAKGCVTSPNSSPCDDGSVCTVQDTCAGGVCDKGLAKTCDDNNACTDDSCDEVKGCVSLANAVTCSDGNACTAGDTCKDGACASGQAVECVDANPCTTDVCLAASGCQHLANKAACDDGDACTVQDVCADSKCVAGEPQTCADGNPCTDDACEPAKGCTHVNSEKDCDDGNKCTLEDHCLAGNCVPGKAPACDDGNPCTTATCDPGQGCQNLANALPCSDGDACTSADKCAGGACTAGAAVACSDGNGCTADTCKPASGCVFLATAVTCTDGNACTVADACLAGVCKAGAAAACDDANPCTTDVCKPDSGCASVANTLPCDDGNICTAGDVCGGGACVPGKALPCADGNSCTDDGCDKGAGCVFLANAVTCSDGNVCSAGDACSEGVCAAGKAVDCDDKNACTLNYCDALGGCKAVAKPGPCDDGSVCTTGDVCAGVKCQGLTLSCGDGNPCSKDSCDALKGCQHAALDGVACGQAGICKAGTCQTGSQLNPAASCSELRDLAPGTPSGLRWIDPDGKAGGGAPYQVHCDMGHDGGGWTLVAVASSDGQNTWTWNNRTYWTTNTKTFGSLSALNKDFKSPAYHGLSTEEVLFVHQPSAVWATYLVGDGKKSLAAIQTAHGDSKCLDPANDGFDLVAGNLKTGGKLCNDKLYWAALDKDGGVGCGDNEHSYGPTFNGRSNAATCHFDDPGMSGGLGPLSGAAGVEYPALGFGLALGLNAGQVGAAQNYIQVYVRNVPPPGCGNGKLEPGEKCDDGNTADGDGCSKTCVVEVHASCKALAKGTPSGIYMIDGDGDGPAAPFATRCEMTLDGGGWTLVAVSSDDGKHTWTWNNRSFWTTNTAVFGDASALHRDFKCRALHDLKFSDLLFVHAPSNTWAAYGKVGDGKTSLAQHITAVGGPKCHAPGSGHPVTAGTLKAGVNLCEDRLYFNAHDHDGKPTSCGDNDATWGPSWSGSANNGCPFDDPGDTGSLGPIVGSPGSERAAVGWGGALGLNKGAAGTGANHMKVYIR